MMMIVPNAGQHLQTLSIEAVAGLLTIEPINFGISLATVGCHYGSN